MKFKIEPREKFWKEKQYQVIESGPGWKVERLIDKPVPVRTDLNEMLIKALRKKRYKWE